MFALRACHWTPNWFSWFSPDVLETIMKRAENTLSVVQLFSHRRMSFDKKSLISSSASRDGNENIFHGNVWKTSFPSLTAEENSRDKSCGIISDTVIKTITRLFSYDNLFISLLSSLHCRCTIRSRWSRLIVKTEMVSVVRQFIAQSFFAIKEDDKIAAMKVSIASPN